MAHLHSIYDTDPHFSIDPVTRAIKNESTRKTALVQGDHNSERFTFEVPRFVEGHDMSLSTRIEVHFINFASDKSGQSENVYIVDDMQISPNSEDESIVIFSWLLSTNATTYNGTLAFAIRFVCLTGEKIDYAWHTAPYKGISISEGINNGEKVIEDNSDILAAWERDINELAWRVENLEKNGGGGDGSSVEIVQGTGESTTAVMSQKASTESFVPLRRDIGEYPSLYQVSTNGSNGLRYLQSIWQDDASVLIPYSAVQRDNNNCIQVSDPVKSIDTANKRFVENLVGVWQSGYVQGANELILSVRADGWSGGTVHAAFYGTSGGEIVVHLYHWNNTTNLIDGSAIGYLYYDKSSAPYQEMNTYATINGEVQDGSQIEITCTVIASKI